jgi:transcriptional regulator with XRE-family HTH domain
VSEFLATRRARLTPQDVGLPTHGANRRVPGLRREEVAVLAGVSIDYYTRLERGNLSGVSDSVLEAVARALQLDGQSCPTRSRSNALRCSRRPAAGTSVSALRTSLVSAQRVGNTRPESMRRTENQQPPRGTERSEVIRMRHGDIDVGTSPAGRCAADCRVGRTDGRLQGKAEVQPQADVQPQPDVAEWVVTRRARKTSRPSIVSTVRRSRPECADGGRGLLLERPPAEVLCLGVGQ